MKFLSQSNPCFLILVLLSAATLGRSTAFVVVPLPNRRTAVVGPIQNKNDGRLFVSANEEEEEGTLGGEPSTTTPTTPVKDVKCPDCDLCDGSGRCVSLLLLSLRVLHRGWARRSNVFFFRDSHVAPFASFRFSSLYIFQNCGRDRCCCTMVAHQSVPTMSQFYRTWRSVRTIRTRSGWNCFWTRQIIRRPSKQASKQTSNIPSQGKWDN
jgi:hypothetical protein